MGDCTRELPAAAIPRAPACRAVHASLIAIAAAGALALAGVARGAADFRSAAEIATILYDAPSQKAKPVFVVGRDYPLEVLVSLEGWLKVRDATGSLAWVERKSVSDRRMVMVRVPVAEIHAAADPSAPVAFRVEQNVLLQLEEGTDAAPAGWAAVRHRDGQSGFIRLQQVWGY